MPSDTHLRSNPSHSRSRRISSALRSLSINEHVVMAVLATLVGLAAGLGALGFRYLVNFFQLIAYGSEGNLLEIIKPIPWYVKIWVPAAGGLVVGILIYFFMREARGIGVSDVMEAVALRKGVIKKRLLFSESLTSAITIGTGGSAGVIAPTVVIGSSLGSIAGQLLKEGDLIPSVRELARELTINPNTVARAYRRLQDDGVLTSVRGTGLAVAAGAGLRCQEERVELIRARLEQVLTEARQSRIDPQKLRAIVEQQLQDSSKPSERNSH